eukprot:CAMPEP_0179091054 /NCGR_PEP_ID=MMETSP0796-20121207/41575_1 /TAXON_ID=73915 /ORGANISM="Pyrodinium bahamense, Strain pbaha01" /LENGTH=48 /DNA_ID= /DNA_START= /DNA_END= /DNA_ORIENTATION=
MEEVHASTQMIEAKFGLEDYCCVEISVLMKVSQYTLDWLDENLRAEKD